MRGRAIIINLDTLYSSCRLSCLKCKLLPYGFKNWIIIRNDLAQQGTVQKWEINIQRVAFILIKSYFLTSTNAISNTFWKRFPSSVSGKELFNCPLRSHEL
jgi:hypothetical protein